MWSRVPGCRIHAPKCESRACAGVPERPPRWHHGAPKLPFAALTEARVVGEAFADAVDSRNLPRQRRRVDHRCASVVEAPPKRHNRPTGASGRSRPETPLPGSCAPGATEAAGLAGCRCRLCSLQRHHEGVAEEARETSTGAPLKRRPDRSPEVPRVRRVTRYHERRRGAQCGSGAHATPTPNRRNGVRRRTKRVRRVDTAEAEAYPFAGVRDVTHGSAEAAREKRITHEGRRDRRGEPRSRRPKAELGDLPVRGGTSP